MSQELIGYVYDIQKFSVHDGPGIRTTVFLKGCPLHCLWCHSPESQSFGSDLAFMDIRCIGMEYGAPCRTICDRGAITAGERRLDPKENQEVTFPLIDRTKCDTCLKCVSACPSAALYDPRQPKTVPMVMRVVSQDRRYYAKSGGGVTISGGEPMSQFPFTLALAQACHREGFTVALDTTGFAPTQQYLEILPYVDLFLYDLKHMDSHHHKMLTGVPNELIRENARVLAEAGARFQFRFPMIPKLNATEENIRATADFCAELKANIDVVQLLPYHKLGKLKYDRLGLRYRLTNVEPPTDAFMNEALQLFQSCGLNAMIH